jgi:hypothetical protein
LDTLERLEQIIHRDPARRGLCGAQSQPLCPGDLAAAVRRLGPRNVVALVTGFYIPHGQPPAVETDGISGSLFLARALHELGCEVWIVADHHALSAVKVGMQIVGLPPGRLLEFPFDPDASEGDRKESNPGAPERWVEEFYQRGPGRKLTHLVAVERVGPSHTPESLCRQPRSAQAPLEQFTREVPENAHDQCHNMAGRNITVHTARTHLLFDLVRAHRPDLCTIAVGDGGNEIGMGKIAWERLRCLVPGAQAGRIICRIATDYNIVGGTSNWGANALAAGVLARAGHCRLLEQWDHDYELQLLEAIVDRGPAVDGVTGLRQPTVDGLPFETYYQILDGIRQCMLAAGHARSTERSNHGPYPSMHSCGADHA